MVSSLTCERHKCMPSAEKPTSFNFYILLGRLVA